MENWNIRLLIQDARQKLAGRDAHRLAALHTGVTVAAALAVTLLQYALALGIGKTSGQYVEICDRREAIAYVISHAKEGDIIVLAGKGHEDYQEIKGVQYPMDERVIIRELLDSGLEHI